MADIGHKQKKQYDKEICKPFMAMKTHFYVVLLILGIFYLLPVFHTDSKVLAATGSTLSITVYAGKDVDLMEYLQNTTSVKQYISDLKPTYENGNKKIATVTKNGLVKGIAKGKTQITVALPYYRWSDKLMDSILSYNKKIVNVTVIPYDGSTDRKYFCYTVDAGKAVLNYLSETLTDDLVIPRWMNGFPVTAIDSYAFDGCKMKSVTCFDNIKTIGDQAFTGCNNLKSVKLTNEVESIGKYAFADCTNLEAINLPSELVAISQGVFAECSRLKEITLGSKVKIIGAYAFSACSSINNIDFPDSLEVIEKEAFSRCSNWNKLILPAQIKQIGDLAFIGCSSIKKIEVSDSQADSSSTEEEKTHNTGNSIGEQAFVDCDSLTEVEIPNEISVIGMSAFYDCKNLKTIMLPEGVTSLGSTIFSGCDVLCNIRLPESLVSIGNYAFQDCIGLIELNIPDAVKKIEDNAFDRCINLTKFKATDHIDREIGENLFSNTPIDFDSLPKAYLHNITFQFTEDDWNQMKMILAAVQEAGVQDTDSDLEKIRKIHDWMVIHISYSLKQYNAYKEEIGIVNTVLDKRFAVCDGYAKVFEVFMDLFNIECFEVISYPMSHGWNMVKLDDGCWYHIDVTWDDPNYDLDEWQKGYLRYENLLRDDQGIKATGHHDWQEDAPAANGTKYLNYYDINYIIKFY